MSKKEKIIIFDTTLRDGEQSPGASLNTKQKLRIAHQLAALNVDVIEAGFPIASPGDFAAVKTIAKEIKGPIICGLARANKLDIDRAYEAVKYSERPRIHTFIATSDIHLQYKLKKTPAEVLKQAKEMVGYAKKKCDDVEFSPEDAGRSDPQYLYQVIEAVISAGAKTVNIPDTVGYTIPDEFGKLIKGIKENVPNINKAIISVHCHNDLGLATANSLSAVLNGARQIECTINGIGERAGNCALEEVVMGINTRREHFKIFTSIKTKELYRTSRMVAELTGVVVQPNKAIVGANAFAHEAGIHQDGILKHQSTYEIMKPEEIGVKESKLVLGKHSGRHAFKKKLEDLKIKLSAEELEKAFNRFKDLADKKKEVLEEDILAIVGEELANVKQYYILDYFNITSGNKTIPTATVRIISEGKVYQEAACGDGPIDAAFKAVDKITNIFPKLKDYKLKAVTGGKDALGEVTVVIANNGETFYGRGTSTDILESSIKAYLNAVNKLVSSKTSNSGK